MPEPAVQRFAASDGVELAFTDTGRGRVVMALHGSGASGREWWDHGPAAALLAAGHRIVLPDLRGHGRSDRPRDATAYPPDVLADDGLALVRRLELPDGGWDLAGYSLGGHVALRMLVRGARPRRAVIAGQGVETLHGGSAESGAFRRMLETVAAGRPLVAGTAEAEAARLLRELGDDAATRLLMVDSLVATPAAELSGITAETLVAVGEDDDRADTARQLVEALPDARFIGVPGDHVGALGSAQFARAVVTFLADQPASR